MKAFNEMRMRLDLAGNKHRERLWSLRWHLVAVGEHFVEEVGPRGGLIVPCLVATCTTVSGAFVDATDPPNIVYRYLKKVADALFA